MVTLSPKALRIFSHLPLLVLSTKAKKKNKSRRIRAAGLQGASGQSPGRVTLGRLDFAPARGPGGVRAGRGFPGELRPRPGPAPSPWPRPSSGRPRPRAGFNQVEKDLRPSGRTAAPRGVGTLRAPRSRSGLQRSNSPGRAAGDRGGASGLGRGRLEAGQARRRDREGARGGGGRTRGGEAGALHPGLSRLLSEARAGGARRGPR